MRKLLAVLFIVSMISLGSAFAGGDGSQSDPYQIENWDDLDQINNDPSAYYVLVNDIDENSFGSPLAEPWLPIQNFNGTLYGNGYTISNFAIDGDGFFNTISGNVNNLGFENVTMNNYGSEDVGIVASDLDTGGELYKVYTTGSIGSNTETTSPTGGLIGSMQSGSLVNQTYSRVDIQTSSLASGLVGLQEGGTIEDSYATGTLGGPFYEANGITYQNSGSVVNSYYDEDTTLASGGPGTPLSTSEMQGFDAASNMVGFDFGTDWDVFSGEYPILIFESAPVSQPDPAVPQSPIGDSFSFDTTAVNLTVQVNDNSTYDDLEWYFGEQGSVSLENTETIQNIGEYNQEVTVSRDTDYEWRVELIDNDGTNYVTNTSSFSVEPFVGATISSVSPANQSTFAWDVGTISPEVDVQMNDEDFTNRYLYVNGQEVDVGSSSLSGTYSFSFNVDSNSTYDWYATVESPDGDTFNTTETRTLTTEPEPITQTLESPADGQTYPFYTDNVTLTGNVSLGDYPSTELNWTVNGNTVNTQEITTSGEYSYDFAVQEGENYTWSMETEETQTSSRSFSIEEQGSGYWEGQKTFTFEQEALETSVQGEVNLTLNGQEYDLTDGENTIILSNSTFDIRYDLLETQAEPNPRVENLTFISTEEEGVIETHTFDLEDGTNTYSLSPYFGEDPNFIDVRVDISDQGPGTPKLNYYNLTYTDDEEVRSIGFDEYDVGLILMLVLIGVFGMFVLKS